MKTARRAVIASAAALVTLFSTGCASSRLVGTWESQRAVENRTPAEFDFASVTFAPDGTYTAEMVYGGSTHAETGAWKVRGDKLEVGTDKPRVYQVEFEGNDEVTFDAGRAGRVSMRRFRP
ncbi:MAG: hypothetical protein CMJ31_08050 [Phycisphaerae bacterium]|nr:hypothetical protein [Phycisphaerae bacterium]